MIEPTWFWLKKRTTLRGAPANKKTARAAWIKAWQELPQKRIQEWIERIVRHIQEVIRLEGGNEYEESRTGKDSRSFKGERIKGRLSKRALWEHIDDIIAKSGNNNGFNVEIIEEDDEEGSSSNSDREDVRTHG
jgi:hypothetical protein